LVEGGERRSAAGRSPRFAALQQIYTDNAARAGEPQSRQPLIDLVEQACGVAPAVFIELEAHPPDLGVGDRSNPPPTPASSAAARILGIA
jgi:hypothetical protein